MCVCTRTSIRMHGSTYHLWTSRTTQHEVYQMKLTANDICSFFNAWKIQYTYTCFSAEIGKNVSSLCLPPTRVSCWLNLLTLHWLIQQHPQTKGWHELRSNQVQHWIHSGTARDGKSPQKGFVRINNNMRVDINIVWAEFFHSRSQGDNEWEGDGGHNSHRTLLFRSPIHFSPVLGWI